MHRPVTTEVAQKYKARTKPTHQDRLSLTTLPQMLSIARSLSQQAPRRSPQMEKQRTKLRARPTMDSLSLRSELWLCEVSRPKNSDIKRRLAKESAMKRKATTHATSAAKLRSVTSLTVTWCSNISRQWATSRGTVPMRIILLRYLASRLSGTLFTMTMWLNRESKSSPWTGKKERPSKLMFVLCKRTTLSSQTERKLNGMEIHDSD